MVHPGCVAFGHYDKRDEWIGHRPRLHSRLPLLPIIVLDEIETRAAVELAKLEMASRGV